jgi:hypothetical protein
MQRLKARGRSRWGARAGALVIGTAGVLVAPSAHAHFVLLAPPSWMSQDASGLPEKLGPCGDEGGGTPTGILTAFHPGDTISLTIDEVVAHPGHYRVALAVNDRSELPPEPEVTPKTGDPCGSAAIEDPPTFPILADNVLPHTQPFTEPQTFTVTLPSDVTCTRCTLQVLEFMSSHAAPCFYHHCADISIEGASGSTTSTTVPAGGPTTTTLPCATPRCSVDAVLDGPACASDTIPAAIQRRLDRAPDLLGAAETSPPGRARLLRRRARRLLVRAGGSALRASRRRRPALSARCAASIKQTTDQLADGL